MAGLRVGPSGIVDGRGVFATRPFTAGAIVEDAPCVEIPADQHSPLIDYVFRSPNVGFHLLVTGYGMLYNHDEDANVEVDRSQCPARMLFRAVRDIEAGEELFIHYGPHWWGQRGITPARSAARR